MQFQLAISRASIQEVLERGRWDVLQWALEIADYSEEWLATVAPDSPPVARRLSAVLATPAFGYLGAKDRRLLHNAVLLDCNVFLTMERRLPKNAVHLKKHVGIDLMQPVAYWDRVAPWAGLFR